MNKQKNSLRFYISVTVLFSVFCLGRLNGASTDTEATSIRIVYDLERDEKKGWAKPILDVLDKDMEEAFVKEMESKAVTYCSQNYPFLNWVGASESGPISEPQLRLVIIMKANKGTTGEVYLLCATAIEGEIRTVARATVYEDSMAPPDRLSGTQEEIKTKILDNTMVAMVQLLPEGVDFIKDYPLAKNIYVDPNGHRLIVPIAADKLNAERESILTAEFVTEVKAGNPVDAYAEFQPSGQVWVEGSPLKGMQKCKITLFECEPDYDYQEWHDLIPDVIGKSVNDSMRVYMKEYKQKRVQLASNP